MKTNYLAVASFLFCLHAFPQEYKANVRINVLDEQKDPLSAEVYIQELDFQTHTDNGVAYFDSIPCGRYTFKAEADGFIINISRNFNVVKDEKDNDFTLELDPKKTLVISGRITNINDTSICNKVIILKTNQGEKIELSTKTDATGAFRFDIYKDDLQEVNSLGLTLLYREQIITQILDIPNARPERPYDFIIPEEKDSMVINCFYEYPDNFNSKSDPIILISHSYPVKKSIDKGAFDLKIPIQPESDQFTIRISENKIKSYDSTFSLKKLKESKNFIYIKLEKEIPGYSPFGVFVELAPTLNLNNKDVRWPVAIGGYYIPSFLNNNWAIGFNISPFKNQLSIVNNYETLTGHTGNIETTFDIITFLALRGRYYIKPYTSTNRFNGFIEGVFSIDKFNSITVDHLEENSDLEAFQDNSIVKLVPSFNLGFSANTSWLLTLQFSVGISFYTITTPTYKFDYWGYAFIKQEKSSFVEVPVGVKIIFNIPKNK